MHESRIARGAAVALLAWVVASAASAQQSDPRTAQYLAGNCANCHGTHGRGAGAMPSLAGQKKEYLVEAMRAYRDGKRMATVMHQLSKGYTDAQIDSIAEYFAKQPAE
ncbi:MAG: c-type cytochrome [Gemmatimonadota bacterium]